MSKKMSNAVNTPNATGANMHQIRWMATQLLEAVNGLPGAVSLGNRNVKSINQQELRNHFRQRIALKFQQKYPNA